MELRMNIPAKCLHDKNKVSTDAQIKQTLAKSPKWQINKNQ